MIRAEEQAQRKAALRALLARPLLVADTDGEVFVLVRQHLAELRKWLNRETGWRPVADSETARLFKTASVPSDASHPARGHNKEPFGRRRYVTLCLALSALARADAQTTLGSCSAGASCPQARSSQARSSPRATRKCVVSAELPGIVRLRQLRIAFLVAILMPNPSQ